jgi:hypothetical protein
MKILKTLLVFGLVLLTTEFFAQDLPPSYQGMLDEIVTNFETIQGSNTIKEGNNSLRVLSEDRIVLSVKHKKKVKNLTFMTKKDEEGTKFWAPANPLTIDMVNKYEDFVTEVMETMLDLSEKKSQE